MTENTTPLSVIYKGWETFQRDLVRVVEPLSPEQLALPVSPTHWPIGALVQHFVDNRIWWFHTWLETGDAEIASFMHWEDEGKSVRSAAELVAGLQASWEMIANALAAWTVADLEQIITPPASLSEEERKNGSSTRQQIIFHVLRHDMHHGGELALGLGGYGLPTIWG